MHACIELDMDGPTSDTFLARCLDEGIHETEGIDLGLEIVVEHGLEGGHLRIHDHDVGSDACLAQGDTLVGYGHSKVIDTLILQRFGYLHGSCTIAIGLDHAHHLGVGLEERAEVIEVLDHRIEVDLEDGLVDLLLQLLRNLVETKGTGSLQEDEFIAEP